MTYLITINLDNHLSRFVVLENVTSLSMFSFFLERREYVINGELPLKGLLISNCNKYSSEIVS